MTDTIESLCAEFDIEIVSADCVPKPGQTRAIATLERILKKHGAGHLRLVLSTLSETRYKEGLITEATAWAVSDLVLAYRGWIEANAGEWLAAWDHIPLGYVMFKSMELAGIVPLRHALAGVLHYFLGYVRQDLQTGVDPSPGFARLVKAMEAQLETEKERKAERLRLQTIELGKALLEVKAALPHGEFIAWVKGQSGVSYGIAVDAMRDVPA